LIRIVSAEELLSDAFQERWTAFLRKCPPHDLGQTYAWNRCWWKYFESQGASEKKLLLLAEEKDGELEAIWPLFVRRRWGVKVIHWIGQTEGMITDYMLPLVPATARETAARSLFEFLAQESQMWDVLDLRIPLWSGLFATLTKVAIVHGSRTGLTWTSGIADHCSAIALPATFDEFLASLGSTTRHHVKQYLRGASKAGAQFEIIRGRDVGALLPDLFRLNGERWQVFGNSVSRAFLTEVTSRVTECDSSLFLACLRLEDRTVAIALCYEHANICYIHSAGVIRQSPKGFSPGTTLYSFLVRALVERHQVRLDLSPGLEEYKLRLGATTEPIFRFTLWHTRAAYKRWRSIEMSQKVKYGAVVTVRSWFRDKTVGG